MAFEFVPATDERTKFTAAIPHGGKTYEFSVPLMQFVSGKLYRDFAKWNDDNDEKELLAQGVRPVEAAFDWWMENLKIENWKLFRDELVFGEKTQLWDEWVRLSNIPLGESSPSSVS